MSATVSRRVSPLPLQPPSPKDHREPPEASLRHRIEHLAHRLPAQGPITVFVHHNTLHAFEDLPFDQAVVEGAKVFGCQPYLSEARYRELLAPERIRLSDLKAVLWQDLSEKAFESIAGLATRFELRLTMLQSAPQLAPSAELRWLIAETDALRQFRRDVPEMVRKKLIEETRRWAMRDLRDGPSTSQVAEGSTAPHSDQERARHSLASLIDRFGRSTIEHWTEATWEAFSLNALWRASRQGIHGVPSRPGSPAPVRHRDVLLHATGMDCDRHVHPILIRLCAAFLDQGLSAWRLPGRERGLFKAFLSLFRQPGGPPDQWCRGLSRELQRIESLGLGPVECLQDSLKLLGVSEAEEDAFLSETLLALRGWAGMIWQMETRGDRVPNPAPAGSLVEFLAVRLILDRLAITHVARESLNFHGPLSEVRGAARKAAGPQEAYGVDQRAFLVFHVAQSMGWTPETLFQLSKADWGTLMQELEDFSSLERRRIFHQAYERRYRVTALDAISAHAQRRTIPRGCMPRPRFQLFCCIDDREESFRRHLEEIAPDCETFGAAGFYSVAMYYKGAADAHFNPLCPIIVRPRHWVTEDVALPLESEHRRKRVTRRLVGRLSHLVHRGSRTLAGGALTALAGSLATVPLVARVLVPRLTAQLKRMFGRFIEPPVVRRLVLERAAAEPGPGPGQIGFTVEEMADSVERLLRDTGLTSNFSRLVLILGHGSSSVNNPHESAYNCGACAGARGGPNARAFAQMANDARVRARVADRGIEIPEDTVFVGGFHNTCDDNVIFFDLDRLPHGHIPEFQQACRDIDEARCRNAHERCRRFESAPLDLSPEAALRHVENRSEDLAQARPEYNHATNALTYVGRRDRTRGLFLDRRVFLTSYDPTQDDPEASLLARVLQPVIPVCAGISLEYYFSCVDPAGYGCNNKLPHNVTSLLGVMLGAASDLQPGLNQQMIEIHEPMRQVFVVETTPEAMRKVIDRNPEIERLCRNHWIVLATLDPHSSAIHLYRQGRFELHEPESTTLPRVGRSVEWYRGWRDHLGFAEIGPAEN